MLTRVELLRVSRGIELPDLVNESGMSRQHLLRIRKAEIEPGRDIIAALVSAFRHLTLEDIQPDDVIELSREESGPWRKVKKHRVTADVEAWRRERDAAAELLKELRTIAPAAWLDTLRQRKASDAFVRALIFEGRERIDTEPERSELYFDTAAKFAEELTELRREYRLTLVGRAWLARGTVLLKMGNLEDAERVLRRAVNIFAAVDDHRRIARVRMVEAGVLFERSDFAGARELWLSTAPVFQAAKERHSLAVVWLNAGWCDIELNEPQSARAWLEKALDAFTRLRCEVEVLRTRWCLARLTALFEKRAEGVRALAAVRVEFEQRRLMTDAGMVSLDIAEALLLPPRRPQAAAQVCATGAGTLPKGRREPRGDEGGCLPPRRGERGQAPGGGREARPHLSRPRG